MAKISVIVPVYKVEKYIHRCLNSILCQTFADLEIILVDDGSPDDCGKICEEYARKDERVKVIHKENGGLSDARNSGLAQAESDYVIFLDSDDYVEKDMLEYLYKNIVKFGTDIATCGTYDVYAGSVEKQKEIPVFTCSGEMAFAYILRGELIRGEIWNKLIKKEVIGELRFPKGRLYEDIFFTADLMPRVRRVSVGTAPKYYYVHRTGSITGKRYRPQLMDIVDAYTKNYEVVKAVYPDLEKEAECLWIWSRFIVLDKMLLEDGYREIAEYDEVVRFLKRKFVRVLSNPHFNFKRKISLVLLMLHIKLYRFVMKRGTGKSELIKG